MKHTPTPWIVIYHSHGDVFEVKVVEDKMVADGLAEDADRATAGNVETLSLPAAKLFMACTAHDRLVKQRDALLEAAHGITLDAGPAQADDLSRGVVISTESYDATLRAIALAEGGKEGRK